MLETFITIIHVVTCIILVLLVLLQQGKGADAGAAFGGGSQTLFGASGADNLLTKITTGCAALFMITSVLLTVRASKPGIPGGELMEGLPTKASTSAAAKTPAAPVTSDETAPSAPANDSAATNNTTSPATSSGEAVTGTQNPPPTETGSQPTPSSP